MTSPGVSPMSDAGTGVPGSDVSVPSMEGGIVFRAGAAFELCGAPVECQKGSEPKRYGTTCVCEPRCSDKDAYTFGAPSCPTAPAGMAAPFCDVLGWCELPCKAFGDTASCPEGLACGVTLHGLRCITTPAIAAAFARPDPRTTIRDFELYGACRTYEKPACPSTDMGVGEAFTTPADCFCSSLCLDDGDCPVPPAGYGRAACLRYDLSRKGLETAGHCALVCAASENEFPCPLGLSCRAPPPTSCDDSLYNKPSSDVSVCRGGYYHHGNGNDAIEPGEVYGIQIPPSAMCDHDADPPVNDPCGGVCNPGIPWSSAGTCPGPLCCSDADCPAPPPSYPPAVCAKGQCAVSCRSGADCPVGYLCTDVSLSQKKQLVCK
jgi:hypothetical protein